MAGDDASIVQRFKDYLALATVSSTGPKNGEHAKAVEFIREYAEEVGLEYAVHEPLPNLKLIVLTWVGTEPSLGSVLLNSHYDVVPAEVGKWATDPFTPTENERGDIFARGTQDMKCVFIGYMEAIRRLKAQGASFARTIHLTITPDEEIGSLSFGKFVQSEEFHKLRVAVSLDEGLANPEDKYTLFYGERSLSWVRLKAEGPAGHGSRFIPNTATEQLLKVLHKVMEFRREQELLLGMGGCAHAKAKKLGDVQSVNITMIRVGEANPEGSAFEYSLNVVPSVAEAGFDTRIPPTTTREEFDALLQGWVEGTGVEYKFEIEPSMQLISSSPEEEKKVTWHKVIEGALSQMEVEVENEIFPAGTDSRLVRMVDIPAFGFSPMKNTPILLHDHNEFLNKNVLLEGIGAYERIIPALASDTTQTWFYTGPSVAPPKE